MPTGSATYSGADGWEIVAAPTEDPANGPGNESDADHTITYDVDYEHSGVSSGTISFPVNVTMASEITFENVGVSVGQCTPVYEYVFTVRIPQASIEALIPANATITRVQANASISWAYGVAVFILARGSCSIAMGGGAGAGTMGWIAFNPGEELSGTDTASLLSAIVSIPRDDFYAHTRNQFILKNKLFVGDTTRLIRGIRNGSTSGSNLPSYQCSLDMSVVSAEIFYETPDGDIVVTGSGGLEVGVASGGADIILSADPSGLYTLVPGQRFDRVYTRNSDPAQTTDVAIPRPFGKSGFIGG